MLKIQNDSSPTLQPPGKGLPKFELYMARLLVGWKFRRMSRAEADSTLEFEKREILKLTKDVEQTIGCKKVLIDRLRGLEDSSRFWSIYMTVDHLRIVNQGTINLITCLVDGKTPARKISTADVKPSPSADIDSIQEFEKVCNNLQEVVRGIDNLKTSLTWAHPWFGEFTAEKWYFLTGFHMGLHKKQILAIRSKLLGV